MDSFAGNCHIDRILAVDLPYLEGDLSSRFSLHLVAAFLGLETDGRNSVDGKDFVTADKPVLVGRRPVIWLIYNHIAFRTLVYDVPDAPVGFREHHLKVFIFFLRYIYGIWVEFLQHCIHAGAHYPVHRKGVHIGLVQLLEDCTLDFGPLSHLERLALGIR